MSKTFRVDMISHKTIEVTADDMRSAVLLAESAHTDYKVDCITENNTANQSGVCYCLGCDKVILEDIDDYDEDADSSDKFCVECRDDEEFQAAMREGGDDQENGEDKD